MSVGIECLRVGCPYCIDDDEALYCVIEGGEFCKLILNNIVKKSEAEE